MPQSPIPKSREFWEWKHLQNPFGPSPVLLAFHGSEIIAIRAFLRWIWRSGDRNFQTVRAVDTATHPDYRSRGLFSKLTLQLLEQMQTEGVSFVFNTPNRSSLPGYLKMGWQKVTRVPVRIRFLRPANMLKGLLSSSSLTSMAEKTQSMGMPSLLSHPGLARLLSEMREDVRYRTPKTIEYLKWRYQDIPGLVYHAKWSFEENGAAVVIYRERFRRRFLELSISELLIGPGRTSISFGRDLISDVASSSNADYILATAAHDTPELTVMKASGFVPIPSAGPVLAARLLNHQNMKIEPLQWKNWCCSLGDLEIF